MEASRWPAPDPEEQKPVTVDGDYGGCGVSTDGENYDYLVRLAKEQAKRLREESGSPQQYFDEPGAQETAIELAPEDDPSRRVE